MKKTFLWAVLVIAVLAIVYAASVRPTSNEPITIGYIGPLSGPSAVLGMDAIKAIEIAVDEANSSGGINGRIVRLVSQDDQYLTKNTVSAYRKMVDTDKAKVIMVATYGGVLAIKDLPKKDGVVVIDPLDCNADLADAARNIFCIATETESIGQSLANHLVSQDKMSAGILYSTKDQFMSLVADAFRDTYESKGGKVTVDSFNYDDTDFRTQLIKMKSANVQALVLLGHDETGAIMKQTRELGIKAPFFATGTITSPGAQEIAQGHAEGTVFAFWDADPNDSGSREFTEKFAKLVGRPPILPLTTHPAYDATGILLKEVFPKIKGQVGADEIKARLLEVRDYQGITGSISINANGAAPIKESVYRLVKGAPVKI